jgi:D-glycero-D-manno-heptose 1,7-bisphosphate phosphatase
MALSVDRVVRGLLFDRDDTLVIDVPYNADPDAVVPVPGARRAVERARAAGLPVGVVTNQSVIARGGATREQVDACACRKPRPGLVLQAAERLGVPASELVVIGDIGADVGAAAAAGAQSILVPTPRTRQEEVDAAPTVAATIEDAVAMALARVAAARA